MSKRTTTMLKQMRALCETHDLMVLQDVSEPEYEVCKNCNGLYYERECFQCDEGLVPLGPAEPIVWLSTLHDPSVGIEGERLSPHFKTEAALAGWCYKNRARIEDVLERMRLNATHNKADSKLKRLLGELKCL